MLVLFINQLDIRNLKAIREILTFKLIHLVAIIVKVVVLVAQVKIVIIVKDRKIVRKLNVFIAKKLDMV